MSNQFNFQIDNDEWMPIYFELENINTESRVRNVELPETSVVHHPQKPQYRKFENFTSGAGHSFFKDTDLSTATPRSNDGDGHRDHLITVPSQTLKMINARSFSFREEILQEWEGRVVEITKTDFTANLINLTSGEREEQEKVSLPISELAEDDLRRMAIGSIFRWIIGYRYRPSGSKERTSRIILRRLPVWTKSEIKSAEEKARNVVESLAWD
jgi:hypothetical protein